MLIHCLLLTFVAVAQAQQGQLSLHGTVVDSSGAPVAAVRIEFRSAAGPRLTTTNDRGDFAISDITGEGTLLVTQPGFAPVSIEITRDSANDQIRVRLTPSPIIERIVVSAKGEDRIPAVPNGQFSLPGREIEVSGSLVLDDVLRQVPGFTLFRRSGSLFANPTSQGVSLRGVGANGASRASVLLDGVPLNSPFGGWVYWNRVPRVSIERVEVLNGGASDLYGSGAMGGVVNLESRRALTSFIKAEGSYGNQTTPNLSLSTGVVHGKWSVYADAQALRTDGYVLVPTSQRGGVDTPAGTSDVTGLLRLSRKLSDEGGFFLRTSSFGESRRNGTPVQVNNTRIWGVDLGLDWMHAMGGYLALRLYGSGELFNQNFSSIAADRQSESLTNRQRNPAQQLGLVGSWRRAFAGKHTVTVGFEGRDMRGHSAETTFNSGRSTANVDAGGRQSSMGTFGQAVLQFGRTWVLTLGGRVDTWENTRGFSDRTPLPVGARTSNQFPNTSETALSPRISLLHTYKDLAFTVSFYRDFRAPTLNELYRNFRVGNVVTNANPALRAERLTGGEGGVSLRRWADRLTVRGVFFWSEIADPIANVTLSATPTLITRQRQNLGMVRARGVEFSAQVRLPKNLQLSSEYILTDSRVVSFPANLALEGLRVPQVATHQINAQLSYAGRNWSAGLQGRFVGKQFDDDQNTLPLASFFTLDAELSRRLSSHAQLFLAVQNITGVRYQVSRTPLLTIGPPVLARAGFRLSFP